MAILTSIQEELNGGKGPITLFFREGNDAE